jgi:hypothetical protein
MLIRFLAAPLIGVSTEPKSYRLSVKGTLDNELRRLCGPGLELGEFVEFVFGFESLFAGLRGVDGVD